MAHDGRLLWLAAPDERIVAAHDPESEKTEARLSYAHEVWDVCPAEDGLWLAPAGGKPRRPDRLGVVPRAGRDAELRLPGRRRLGPRALRREALAAAPPQPQALLHRSEKRQDQLDRAHAARDLQPGRVPQRALADRIG